MHTFKEVALDYLDQPTKFGKEKSHIAELRLTEMIESFGDKPIQDIDEFQVKAFFRSIKKKKLANATYNTYVTYYHAVMNYAIDELGVIKEFCKMKSLPERQRTDFLEPEQFKSLYNNLDPLRQDIVMLLVNTGLRKSNGSQLRVDQVSPCRNFLRFSDRLTKNGKPLEVPLNDKAKEVIEKRLDLIEKMQTKYPYLGTIEHVFVQESGNVKLNGKPIGDLCNKTWRKAVAAAGLPKGTCVHHLRHTFASWHKRAGTNDTLIAKIGGWESMKSLERYGHVSGPDTQRAAANLVVGF
jgi:integrase